MSNLDVTPVGQPHDPFGTPLVEHRRGRVRIALGVLLCVVAAGAIAVAVVGFVREQGALLDGAVAEGRLGGAPVRFETDAGPYTILMRTPRFANDTALEREVARTVCVIEFAGAEPITVRGNRQGVSTTTDSARSIGVFDAMPGAASAVCGPRSGPQLRDRAFVVSPGKASFATMGLPLAVALLAGLLGGLLIAWGMRGSVRSRN